MRDDIQVFSLDQAITVSAASNYAGTGAGSAGAGILDCGLLIASFGGSGGYGQNGIFGGSPIRFILSVTVSQMFLGPANATLVVTLQDSADKVNWANTNLGNAVALTLTTLQTPGQMLLTGDLPAIGGSTNPPIGLREYLRIWYAVAGGPFTDGHVNAGLDVM